MSGTDWTTEEHEAWAARTRAQIQELRDDHAHFSAMREIASAVRKSPILAVPRGAEPPDTRDPRLIHADRLEADGLAYAADGLRKEVADIEASRAERAAERAQHLAALIASHRQYSAWSDVRG